MVAAEAERTKKREGLKEQSKLMEEIEKRKEEMRKDGIKAVPGGSL